MKPKRYYAGYNPNGINNTYIHRYGSGDYTWSVIAFIRKRDRDLWVSADNSNNNPTRTIINRNIATKIVGNDCYEGKPIVNNDGEVIGFWLENAREYNPRYFW